ncbi:PCC domain-containing protein [Kitasatospora sp. NPDC059722]|uniref:PCC domain-containing protein n=1 Tax=Kitasatospora sp. NPDC059722 TaxID=3346925 RepID=UPI0036BD92FD
MWGDANGPPGRAGRKGRTVRTVGPDAFGAAPSCKSPHPRRRPSSRGAGRVRSHASETLYGPADNTFFLLRPFSPPPTPGGGRGRGRCPRPVRRGPSRSREIVSAVGEVRNGQAHLHASLAVGDGRVVGGHVRCATVGRHFTRVYLLPTAE